MRFILGVGFGLMLAAVVALTLLYGQEREDVERLERRLDALAALVAKREEQQDGDDRFTDTRFADARESIEKVRKTGECADATLLLWIQTIYTDLLSEWDQDLSENADRAREFVEEDCRP
jgi:uncharacterized Ntn-hydrolase superfamily protein